MNACGTALRVKHTATASELYMALELGEKSWKLALGDGVRAPSHYSVTAGDTCGVLECVAKARARCRLAKGAKVHSCYEAGRDGFWLHRWLLEAGIDNIVVDSASIEVNRRARRAKTDRLDGDKLLAMLIRYHAGERRIWSVLRVPTAQQEDERRAHRELERLVRERTAHSNRIRALLVMHNLRVKYVGGRLWQRWWAAHAGELTPGVCAEIEREAERLLLVRAQMRAIEAQQHQAVAVGSETQVARLAQLGAIGVSSGWVFFVISGHVVSASMAQQRADRFLDFALRFYANRIRRIVPALVVCLLVTTIITTLFVPDAWLSDSNRKTGFFAFFGDVAKPLCTG